MKCFKVKKDDEKRSAGIAANSYEDLLSKGKSELKIEENIPVRILREINGAEVNSEAKFADLPDPSDPSEAETLYFVTDFTWYNAAEHLQNQCMDENAALERQIRTTGSGACVVFLLKNSHPQSLVEEKKKHSDWFKGLRGYYRRKSDYMKKKCERRLKTYKKQAVKELEKKIKEGQMEQKILDELCKQMNDFLEDRTSNLPRLHRTSPEGGQFTCEGLYDQEKCFRSHEINPYKSRCARILFSLWQFDHIIEQSHVRNTLVEAANRRRGKTMNYKPVCTNLFTTENINIVHKDCHDTEGDRQAINNQLRFEDMLG